MASPIRLVVSGAAGRMGRRILALAAAEGEPFKLAAALERSDHPDIGKFVEGLALAAALNEPAEVLIDFSTPASTRRWLDHCAQNGLRMVIGTTGLDENDQRQIDQAARKIAILQSPNMSLVVNLMLKLAAQAAVTLGDGYDVEISETHHRHKKDAPSGTALQLAREICNATDRDFEKTVAFDRHGENCPRRAGQIGMHALRLGDNTGEHTISFAGEGEGLQLRHFSSSRDSYAIGALRAARFIADKKPGRYQMADVLGL